MGADAPRVLTCQHYVLTPTPPVTAVRCPREATRRVRCGTARAWAVCDACAEALRVLWGAGYVEVSNV